MEFTRSRANFLCFIPRHDGRFSRTPDRLYSSDGAQRPNQLSAEPLGTTPAPCTQLGSFVTDPAQFLLALPEDKPFTTQVPASMFDECLQILKRRVQWRVSSTRYNGSLPQGRRFVWRKHYVCDHAGKPRDRRDPNLEPTKRRSRRQSIKIGCPASFTATQEEDSDVVTLVCRFQHQGHAVNTREYWAKSRIPDNVREWIRDLAAEGREQKEIIQMVNEHQKAASSIPATSPSFIPPGVTISRMDVYNIIKRFRASQTKQTSPATSSLDGDHKRAESTSHIDPGTYALLPHAHAHLAAASPEEAVGFAQQWSEVLANLQALQPQMMEYALTAGTSRAASTTAEWSQVMAQLTHAWYVASSLLERNTLPPASGSHV